VGGIAKSDLRRAPTSANELQIFTYRKKSHVYD